MEAILGTSTGSPSVTRVSIFVFICLRAVAVSPAVYAVQLKAARVTQVIKDVKLLGAQGAQRSAAISDDVREGTALRTGTDSRAELTFTDLTITRLGANTVFSFNAGARQLDLGAGDGLVGGTRKECAVNRQT